MDRGKTSWDYLKILVGSKFLVGMTEYNMLFILAGPSRLVGDSINDLLRKWVGNLPPPVDGRSSYDFIRKKAGSLAFRDDSINDMLRELAQAYPNGYPGISNPYAAQSGPSNVF